MAGSLRILNGAEVQRALQRFIEIGEKVAVRSLKLAGMMWASFTFAQTKEADPDAIRSYLMTRIRPTKRRSKFSGTIAEAIMISRLRRQGKRAVNTAELNSLTRKFVTQAVNSAGYQKAGWIPALRSFGARGRKSRGRGRYKSAVPGSAKAPVRGEAQPNGFLQNTARAIDRVQPDVLARTEGQVAAQLEKFLQDDIRAGKRRNGFK